MRLILPLLALLLTTVACGDDDTQPSQAGGDAGADLTDTGNHEEDQSEEPEDVGADTPDEPDAQEDVSPQADIAPDISDEPDMVDPPDLPDPEGCERISVTGEWTLDNATDVSIAYDSVTSPRVNGADPLVTLLFERYSPFADIGTYPLGGDGPDANFGTCAHCVYIGATNPTQAWFADRGTLITQADPYERRLDATVTDLRLIEVDLDPETRASTPVPNGRCIEVDDFTATTEVVPLDGWICPPEQFDDGQACHCGCGAWDPDCNPAVTECPPFDPDCELREELPIENCGAEQVCAFNPETFGGSCTDLCDWNQRTPCPGEATCIYDTGYSGDFCTDSLQRLDPSMIGEPCGANNYQRFCNNVDGFSQGYCGPANICRSICDSQEDCTEPGDTCRFFLFEGEGLGYCGPEPEDG